MNTIPTQGGKLDRWLFVSDVDGTLLGNNLALRQLNQALDETGDSIIVVYNSSRPCANLRHSIEEIADLLVPDFLIGGLGTECQIGPSGQVLADYTASIMHQWDRERVVSILADIGLKPHQDQYQTMFKASYDVSGANQYNLVANRLRAQGLDVKIVFSGETNLDIIPVQAGKGNAISFLGQHLGIKPERVVVAGDSGNDMEMFVSPRRGIIVGNADHDLMSLQGDHIYCASAAHAEGVLEGLRYWGVLS